MSTCCKGWLSITTEISEISFKKIRRRDLIPGHLGPEASMPSPVLCFHPTIKQSLLNCKFNCVVKAALNYLPKVLSQHSWNSKLLKFELSDPFLKFSKKFKRRMFFILEKFRVCPRQLKPSLKMNENCFFFSLKWLPVNHFLAPREMPE